MYRHREHQLMITDCNSISCPQEKVMTVYEEIKYKIQFLRAGKSHSKDCLYKHIKSRSDGMKKICFFYYFSLWIA